MEIESTGAQSQPRRAEVLAAISTAIDLGLGQPMDHMLRSALIATRLADRLGLSADERAATYYATLVSWIGCHADSHEYAGIFGDDIAVRAVSYSVDWAGLPFAGLLMRQVGRGRPAPERALAVAKLFARSGRDLVGMMRSHCASATALASEMGLSDRVGTALQYTFERWDGRGAPHGARGEQLAIEMRVAQLADVAEVWLRLWGEDACREMVRERRGRQFDPEVADAFLGEVWSGMLELEDVWSAALAEAPDDDRVLGPEELHRLVVAAGDFADAKCPFTLGHSRGVAGLAAAAGETLGLDPVSIGRLRRAGHLHDLGRIGVSNAVWEKSAPLSGSDWERVRLYPYLTERVLRRVGGLGAEATLAASHRERLDGSGYPLGLRAVDLSPAQRLLAAADCAHTWREARPHRAARADADVVRGLREQAREGRLDPEAVDAVIAALGQPVSGRPAWPDGLTTREVEVLRLVARASSNREIAAELVVAEKTVRNHIEHIYAKLGVSNRVSAGLYASAHGLAQEFPHPRG
ncbi:HD domain-containing phosphohydrolase [Microbacterium sp. H1-D42]|uniref:HD domain-containing phosphohydrolase n=1 Tax=Microbacterium sp. H1-D42 TaxID=2925844 RepID=UPI001F52DDEC|nr:HD domain-containing phosphohydrolase [Microbacterium sp. H1-D42]UNK72143.1 LuxR C-terminal-related transcriptional regulator [Microbacterium sp. H1-D42]